MYYTYYGVGIGAACTNYLKSFIHADQVHPRVGTALGGVQCGHFRPYIIILDDKIYTTVAPKRADARPGPEISSRGARANGH